MSRITSTLAQLREANRKALVSYIVCGDPTLAATLDAMHELVKAGTDIIELGVAFSDPMAEGPVIQLGHERALKGGASVRATLELVSEFRKQNSETPVVLMGYANPVARMGYAVFAEAAAKAGVDALLTVDLPPEESHELDAELAKHDLDNIYLLAPTSKEARIKTICDAARGFVYYVSVKGVTGSGSLNADDVAQRVEKIRAQAHTPVLVGFGIKDAKSAKAVAACSDGVVVGSAYVSIMAKAADTPMPEVLKELHTLVSSIRQGLDEL